MQEKDLKPKYSPALVFSFLLMLTLSLASCDRESTYEEEDKPYCYWENGQKNCYANPK